MRINGVRYYPKRSVEKQFERYQRRIASYFVCWDDDHEPVFSCKGRVKHIQRQIIRMQVLLNKGG